jgi:hypothetical protein
VFPYRCLVEASDASGGVLVPPEPLSGLLRPCRHERRGIPEGAGRRASDPTPRDGGVWPERLGAIETKRVPVGTPNI